MKVHVAYDDLNSTASKLKEIDSEFNTLIQKLTTTKDEIAADGSNHDKCYKKAVNTLDKLIINYKKHQEALQFIQQQCEAASIAFKKAEDGNIDLTNQIAIDYITQIGTNVLGIDESEFKDLKLEEYTDEELETAAEEAAKADSSETWNTIFDYEDDDILTESGASIATVAKTIIGPETEGEGKEEEDKGKEEKDVPGTNTVSISGSPGASDNSSSGGYTSGGTTVTPIQPIKPIQPEDSNNNAQAENSDESAQTQEQPAQTSEQPAQTSEQSAQTQEQTTQTQEQTAQTPEQPAQTPEQPAQQPYVEEPYQEEYTHTGGGYSSEDGYYSYEEEENGITEDLSGLEVEKEENSDLVENILDDSSEGVSVASEGKKYTKIPSSTTPITTTTTSRSKGNSIIPIAAGISAAAAAGIGAKAYMDRKNNNENGEEYDDEFTSDEWDENSDNVEIDYNDSSNKEEYLEEDDNYEYQAIEDEKYGARNNEELADLQ